MTKIIFDANLIKTLSYFESVTRAKVRDCVVEDENILFIVEENQLRQALGKNAFNVKKLSEALKKRIRMVEYSDDVLKFVRNMLYPQQVKDIRFEEGIITIIGIDTNSKSLIIGRNASNLRRTEGIVQRHFPQVKEIKVV